MKHHLSLGIKDVNYCTLLILEIIFKCLDWNNLSLVNNVFECIDKSSGRRLIHILVHEGLLVSEYEGGSICNENPFIAPSTNALGFNAICQTKDQSVAVIMVHKTLFYLYKFNKLQTF